MQLKTKLFASDAKNKNYEARCDIPYVEILDELPFWHLFGNELTHELVVSDECYILSFGS